MNEAADVCVFCQQPIVRKAQGYNYNEPAPKLIIRSDPYIMDAGEEYHAHYSCFHQAVGIASAFITARGGVKQ